MLLKVAIQFVHLIISSSMYGFESNQFIPLEPCRLNCEIPGCTGVSIGKEEGDTISCTVFQLLRTFRGAARTWPQGWESVNHTQPVQSWEFAVGNLSNPGFPPLQTPITVDHRWIYSGYSLLTVTLKVHRKV